MEEFKVLAMAYIIVGTIFAAGNATLCKNNNSQSKGLIITAFEEEKYYKSGNFCRIVGVITDNKSVKKSNPPMYCVYWKMMHRKSEMK